jgi:hypothetical protein
MLNNKLNITPLKINQIKEIFLHIALKFMLCRSNETSVTRLVKLGLYQKTAIEKQSTFTGE